MTPRTIDTGGDRVDIIALTVGVFATAAPRDRDRHLDVTPGDILSCRHADLPTPIVKMTKTSVRVSVLGIGRGLLEVGCGDANEQVTEVRLPLIRCLYVGCLSAQQCILFFRRARGV